MQATVFVFLGSLLAALAVGLGLTGLIRPAWVRPVFVGWMMLAFPIGWLMSQVMLIVMFALVITPVGCLFRLIGRDPLALTPPRSVGSYWQPKPMPVDVRRYFRQY